MTTETTVFPEGDLQAAEPVRFMAVALGRGPNGWVITIRMNNGVNYALDAEAVLALVESIGQYAERTASAPTEHLDQVLAEAYVAEAYGDPAEPDEDLVH